MFLSIKIIRILSEDADLLEWLCVVTVKIIINSNVINGLLPFAGLMLMTWISSNRTK